MSSLILLSPLLRAKTCTSYNLQATANNARELSSCCCALVHLEKSHKNRLPCPGAVSLSVVPLSPFSRAVEISASLHSGKSSLRNATRTRAALWNRTVSLLISRDITSASAVVHSSRIGRPLCRATCPRLRANFRASRCAFWSHSIAGTCGIW